MSLRLFDSATRSLREFVPVRPGHAGVYLCGPTVQDVPHVGHLRSAIAFDQLRRWLEAGHGLDVTFIRNVTDLDDKILAASSTADVPWWALAYRNERAFARAYEMLGVRAPTYEPRATGYITEMLEFITALVDRGHAYRARDGSGDVYFDVDSWPDYGTLTAQHAGRLTSIGASDHPGKRDPRDFALWKSVRAEASGDRTDRASAAWESPYGRGRPGWHLSCSTMILRHLGATFDIHSGGLDLRFPHHENERAQSRAAGYEFARYWLHNGWLTIGGEKISKSVGNAAGTTSLLREVRPLDLRYYLGSARYRSSLELSAGSMSSASAAMRRIEEFLVRNTSEDAAATGIDVSALPRAFRDAMDDDLNVPTALAVLHDAVHRGNAAAARRSSEELKDATRSVLAMTSILGINPLDHPWNPGQAAERGARHALAAVVSYTLNQRSRARSEGNFETADAIREALMAAGVMVHDESDRTTWSLIDQAAAQSGSAAADHRASSGPDPPVPTATTVAARSQTTGTKPDSCSVVPDDAAANDVNRGERSCRTTTARLLRR